MKRCGGFSYKNQIQIQNQTMQKSNSNPRHNVGWFLFLLGFLIFNCPCCILAGGLNHSVGAIPKKAMSLEN